MVAHLAGGSQLFDFKFRGVGIGKKNSEAARSKLKEMGIIILSDDTGGNYGRTMKIYAGTGEVIISSLNQGSSKRYQSHLSTTMPADLKR